MKFDLGPHVASLVMSTPLFVLTRCSCVEAGGAQVSGGSFRGPYQEVISFARLVPTKAKTEEAEAKPKTNTRPRQAQAKTRAQAEPRTRQGKVSQDQPKQKSNFKRKPSPV